MEHTHKTTRTGVHWVYVGDITKELAGSPSSGGSYILQLVSFIGVIGLVVAVQ